MDLGLTCGVDSDTIRVAPLMWVLFSFFSFSFVFLGGDIYSQKRCENIRGWHAPKYVLDVQYMKATQGSTIYK